MAATALTTQRLPELMPVCTSDSNPTCPGEGSSVTSNSELTIRIANVTPERRRLTKGRTSATDDYLDQPLDARTSRYR